MTTTTNTPAPAGIDTGIDLDKLRVLFETDASDHGKWPRAIERNASGYVLSQTHVAWLNWQRAAAALATSPQIGQKDERALDRYNEHMSDAEELDPVERLRFFCSLAMNGRDWLDVEQFFDALAQAAPADRSEILHEAADMLEAMNDSSGDAAAYDNREMNAHELEREHAIADCVKKLRDAARQPQSAICQGAAQPAGAPTDELPYVEGWSLPRDLATAHAVIQKLRIKYAEEVAKHEGFVERDAAQPAGAGAPSDEIALLRSELEAAKRVAARAHIHRQQMETNKHYRERVFNEIVKRDGAEGIYRFARQGAAPAQAEPVADAHLAGLLHDRRRGIVACNNSLVAEIEKKIIAHVVVRAASKPQAAQIEPAPAPVTQAAICQPGGEPCVICRADEPRTGTCGSDDPRALCNFAPVQSSQAAQPVTDSQITAGTTVLGGYGLTKDGRNAAIDVFDAMGGAAQQVVPTFDFCAHLARQAAWSAQTFGPGPRTAGVCDHIRKELVEIEADPTDLAEWVDVVILGLDGAWRCGGTPDQIIAGIVAKQTKTEGRTWPDWRTADPNKAIEHDRSHDATTKDLK
jgi:hypothetical protein